MNCIGWKEPAAGEKHPNMHTIKTQTVFMRPEQYKDCMDLSLMLAWNAQCTFGHPEKRLPQHEVFKVDKLRGAGEGTGDLAWKIPARARLAASLDDQRKDARIASLQAERADLQADLRRSQHARDTAARTAERATGGGVGGGGSGYGPEKYGKLSFAKAQGLVALDPPVAALLPHRVGSPGTFGVRRQIAQHAAQHARLRASEGKDPAVAPKVTRTGVPEGFHHPPGRTISASHASMAGQRRFHHHQTPAAPDYRNMAEFTANWRSPVPQRRVHSIRDLA